MSGIAYNISFSGYIMGVVEVQKDVMHDIIITLIKGIICEIHFEPIDKFLS